MVLKAKRDQVRTWKNLAWAFLEQYKYMFETALDRFTLQSMKKKLRKSYRDYTVRWKVVALQVKPPSPTKRLIFYFWILFFLHTMTN